MPLRTEIPDSDSTSTLRASSLLPPLLLAAIQLEAELQDDISTIMPTSELYKHIPSSPLRPTLLYNRLPLPISRDAR